MDGSRAELHSGDSGRGVGDGGANGGNIVDELGEDGLNHKMEMRMKTFAAVYLTQRGGVTCHSHVKSTFIRTNGHRARGDVVSGVKPLCFCCSKLNRHTLQITQVGCEEPRPSSKS